MSRQTVAVAKEGEVENKEARLLEMNCDITVLPGNPTKAFLEGDDWDVVSLLAFACMKILMSAGSEMCCCNYSAKHWQLSCCTYASFVFAARRKAGLAARLARVFFVPDHSLQEYTPRSVYVGKYPR